MQSLNQAQKKAVETVFGRILVLAGAGSGKTKVIIHRIAHLIQDHGIDPTKIVGLTFTNKAASEMRHRLQSLIGKQAKLVTISTFHSFCMHILRKEITKLGFTTDFSLYDEKDLDRMINQITKEMLGCENDLPSLASTKALLTTAANSCGKNFTDKSWHDQFSKNLYERLQITLRAYNAVNFDNLINLTIQLFEEHPDVLQKYQEKFQFFMIDEYQDTNPAQFRLAELLASKYNNLCVVGDDDQSIYGWRGAQIENILKFHAHHVIKLEQNYRSHKVILDAANSVIKNNKNRHDKSLWSEQPTHELIEVFNAPTELEEAQSVIDRLIKYKAQGMKWKDMAILYRSNALSRNLEMGLINASWNNNGTFVRGIPYEIFGGLEFSERSEIKDLSSFLRVIANPLDQEALLRIINVPRRGISDEFLDELTSYNRTNNIPLWDVLQEIAQDKLSYNHHPRGVQGIKNFMLLMEKAQNRFSNPPLAEALQWFIEEINYKKAIEEEVKSEKMREFKWENVQECVNALAQFEKENDPILQDFVANTTLAGKNFESASKQTNEDKVQLMTLHSSKGLEFPICFIVGLEDHILPHEKSVELTGIEEERRLFYVGITRAKKNLVLSMSRARMRMGKAQPSNPSRFLFEIPKNLLKIVSHKC